MTSLLTQLNLFEGRLTPVVRVVLIAVGVALLATAVLRLVPSLLVSGENLTAAETQVSRNAVRVAGAQLVAAVGLLGGLWFTARTFVLSRKTHFNERFTEAVEALGSESVSVRMGGVYSLWLLAREEPSYWELVELVLAGLLRERASIPPIGQRSGEVQAAVRVIGERPTRPAALELTDLSLQGVDFSRSKNYRNVLFDRSLLKEANFTDADLNDATFERSDLEGCIFNKAHLINASLSGASAVNASFHDAEVSRLYVEGASFFGAAGLGPEQRKGMKGHPRQDPPPLN